MSANSARAAVQEGQGLRAQDSKASTAPAPKSVHELLQELISRLSRVTCVLLTDKDGVLISRAFQEDAKDKPFCAASEDSLFNVSFAAVSDQVCVLCVYRWSSLSLVSCAVCVHMCWVLVPILLYCDCYVRTHRRASCSSATTSL
jgi:hypothetical protein